MLPHSLVNFALRAAPPVCPCWLLRPLVLADTDLDKCPGGGKGGNEGKEGKGRKRRERGREGRGKEGKEEKGREGGEGEGRKEEKGGREGRGGGRKGRIEKMLPETRLY